MSLEAYGSALKYYILRLKYQQKYCDRDNRICRFCDIKCPFPSYEEWIKEQINNRR